MKVNEKEYMLKSILKKLVTGLIFCLSIIGFNMALGKTSVQAAIIKNMDFKLVSEVPLHIEVWAYDDKKDGAPQSKNWNKEGRGKIECDDPIIDNEDGTDKYVYLVHMRNVNVSNWTPWLSVTAADTVNYTPFDFHRTGKQDYGLTGASDSSKPHYSGDVEKNSDGYLQTYLGMAFNDYRLDAKIGYTLNVNYNGATTHPDQTYFGGYFTKYNPRSGTKGQIPKVFKSGEVQRKGYILDGWYCGSSKLFNADGTPVTGGTYVNGLPWADKSSKPLYMWNGATTITAHWKQQKYDLTLNYNNATKLPDGESMVTTHKNFLKFDSPIGNIYGPGRVKRTGYTFNGWWVCDSSGKVAQLWDADGNLKSGTTIKMGDKYPYWSDDSGNYKWDGNTSVIADWIPNTKSYPLTLDYKGGKVTTGITTTKWPTWFTENEAIKKIDINSSTLTKSGYEFVGWYCDTPSGEAVKLFDSNGNPVKGAKYNGTQWSDSSGKYVFGKGTAVYAMWKEKMTYGLTLDNQGADVRSGTTVIYERYADGFYKESSCKNKIGAITTPKRTGYSFYGYYTAKYTIDTDTSSTDKEKQIINSNGVINVLSTRFTSNVTLYAYWVDDIDPDASANVTYLSVTKTDDKNFIYAKATVDSVTPVSIRRSYTAGTLPEITWDSDWLNKDVAINMYSKDVGAGMKNLLIKRNDGSSWYNWKSQDFSGSKDKVSTSKNNTEEKVSKFYGITTDASHKANKLETKAVTVKIDKTAPTANSDSIEIAVRTGTIYRGVASSYVPNSSKTINDDGTINEAAMRTVIELPLKDSLSGVKLVWADVKDDEHGVTKSFELTRRSALREAHYEKIN